MQNHVLTEVEKYTKKSRKRRTWHKVVSVLACFVVFFTTYALILPAITQEQEANCAVSEHVHAESCYTKNTLRELICNVPEITIHEHSDVCYAAVESVDENYTEETVSSENNEDVVQNSTETEEEHSERVLICEEPEELIHIHDESCYIQTEQEPSLSCLLQEHMHGLACYADLNADLETAETWEQTLSGVEFTGIWTEDVLAIAKTQLGYAESTKNYIVEIRQETDGTVEEIAKGYTRYGAWYGSAYGDWCAMFVSFCLDYAGVEEMPLEAYCPTWIEKLSDEEVGLYYVNEAYVPEISNLVFFDWDLDDEADHVGIVTEVDNTFNDGIVRIITIEGNSGNRVAAQTYALTDETIMGFAKLPYQLNEEEQEEIDKVNGLIEDLPELADITDTLRGMYERSEKEEYAAYYAESSEKSIAAYEAYNALQDVQKKKIVNSEKLEDLSWLWDDSIGMVQPFLMEDEAYVSELTIEKGIVETAEETDTIRSEDKVTFEFSVQLSSYTNAVYGEGRVKFEFLLPLEETEAVFDVSSMQWLDQTEGYQPSVAIQQRYIDGEEKLCQVLTGYKALEWQDAVAAIPGSFSETVVVELINAEAAQDVMTQMSAAMMHNTWDGICSLHQVEEKLVVSAEVNVDVYAEEGSGEATTNDSLSEITEPVSEIAEGDNWIRLKESGWFEEYSDFSTAVSEAVPMMMSFRSFGAEKEVNDILPPESKADTSEIQVDEEGGYNKAEDEVTVSKVISETELENIFDITLTVTTAQSLEEIVEEPDMAVVIVMDISNTMRNPFGSSTRYKAAMEAAENFLDKFAAHNSLGISKVGYVAFNTDAHEIFPLQSCTNQTQANSLKNTMRTETGTIINADGYADAHSRFTNVEAGLTMAYDMLDEVSNSNKFIIFLSDGFPTTYIESGYSGYDPYDTSGRFYDKVLSKDCSLGTSYSDEAAIRARKKATQIKNEDVTIFSIGVDVAGQTIQKYITQSEEADGYSVVDRTGTTYEIGDASSTQAYKDWLRDSIGSGFYYDSTDSSGLLDAYENIFEEIRKKTEEASKVDWVTQDPIPTKNGIDESVEFIGLYDKASKLVGAEVTGENTEGAENTALFDIEEYAIHWDLKQSGYEVSKEDNTVYYKYQLVYRVRLKTEEQDFIEYNVYPTNDITTLRYRMVVEVDGKPYLAAPRTSEFPIPSVHGFLGELEFKKVDASHNAVPGAEFTLRHDSVECAICKGNGTSVEISDQKSVSDQEGTVIFEDIPSGHIYVLWESDVPEGYTSNGEQYSVEVAYGEVYVTVTAQDGTVKDWDGTVLNHTFYELPETGGQGKGVYTVGGSVLVAVACMTLLYKKKKHRRESG